VVETREREPRPFVPLSPFMNGLLLTVLWLVTITAGFFAAVAGRPTLVGVYGAFVLYIIVLSIPLILFGTRSGFFHPLVFFVLWRGFVRVIRVDALIAGGGLTSHRALPDITQAALDHVATKYFLLEVLALAGLYAGYAIVPYLRLPRFPAVSGSAVRTKVILIVGLAAMAVGILAIAAGGISGLLLQRGMPAEDRLRATLGGHWFFVASLGTIGPILWVAFQPRVVRTVFFWLVTLTSLGVVFTARGSRSSVLLAVLLLTITYTLRTRRIPYKTLMAVALGGIVMLGVLEEFRTSTRRIESVEQIEFESGISEGFTEGVTVLVDRGTDNSGQIAILGRVPHEVPHLYGRSYLAIPMIFVPRAIVGEKPATAGKLNAWLVYERLNTGIPAGAVGESFWNFSYIGPLVVFFAFGAVLKIASGIFLANPKNPVVLGAYAYMLVWFVPSSDAMVDFVQAFVGAVLFGLFLAFRFPSTRTRTRPRLRETMQRDPVPAGRGRA
jgi:oligosaccharide repeat unit polymerase